MSALPAVFLKHMNGETSYTDEGTTPGSWPTGGHSFCVLDGL